MFNFGMISYSYIISFQLTLVHFMHIEATRWQIEILCGYWRPALENVGFAAPEIVEYLDILKLKKLHVSAFLHLDHAGAGGMGHSFSYASEVLFSPSIFSSGKGMQG